MAPGLLAQIIVSKFCDHSPFYRQEAIFGTAMGLLCRVRAWPAGWEWAKSHAAPLTLADQLLSEWSGACRSARRSCRSARRSCRFSTRAWWPTQAEKNVQAAVAAKVSRSARAIR
ncbi:MAG: transposase [Rhodoplanes sp.]